MMDSKISTLHSKPNPPSNNPPSTTMASHPNSLLDNSINPTQPLLNNPLLTTTANPRNSNPLLSNTTTTTPTPPLSKAQKKRRRLAKGCQIREASGWTKHVIADGTKKKVEWLAPGVSPSDSSAQKDEGRRIAQEHRRIVKEQSLANGDVSTVRPGPPAQDRDSSAQNIEDGQVFEDRSLTNEESFTRSRCSGPNANSADEKRTSAGEVVMDSEGAHYLPDDLWAILSENQKERFRQKGWGGEREAQGLGEGAAADGAPGLEMAKGVVRAEDPLIVYG